MDKELIKEMIREYENMSDIINKRLSILKSMLGTDIYIASGTPPGNIQKEIEKKRQEIMAEIQKIKTNAQEQVKLYNKPSGIIPFNIGAENGNKDSGK